MLSTLLFQIPGMSKEIPGIAAEWIPKQGMEVAVELHSRVYEGALYLLVFSLLIALAMIPIGAVSDRWSPRQVLLQIGLTVILFVGFPVLFGGIFAVGNVLATKVIMSNEDIEKLNKDFKEAARRKQNEANSQNPDKADKEGKWFAVLAAATAILSPGAAVLPEILLGIATAVFYVATYFINLLWRLFTTILYCIGPVVIILGFIPGWGSRVLGNYFNACLQMSAWQIWITMCAFFVRSADKFLALSNFDLSSPTAFRDSTANHFESIAYALIFALLYLATPFVINAIFPFSRFSAGLATGLVASGVAVKSTVFSIINNAVKLATLGKGRVAA